MGKILMLTALASIVWSLLRGRSWRQALFPVGVCVLGYVALRWGLVSAARARVLLGVGVLLLPWFVAPYVPRLRERARRIRAERAAAQLRAGTPDEPRR